MKLTDLKKVKIILLVMIVFLSYQRPVLAATDYTNVKIPVQQIFSSEAEDISDEFSYVMTTDQNEAPMPEGSRNILLAEDNDLNAEIAKTILENAGLKIDCVEDGIQCVNRIMEMSAGTYDMILMDIQMPKMNGYKATQEIRHLLDRNKACIPIIAMTANAFEEDKRDAIAAGMNGHIAKPIQVDKLLSILSEIIRQQD